ncbi:hypothetical protein [Streptomyces sp. NPDC018056]|uniref:hypothetical protein n=1 Tax=unclassified Streptomyces TaxID=2593676 RepID=UPI0037A402EB
MGIRMLNHRPAVSQTAVGAAPAASPPPVPALASTASTARVPTDLTVTLRRAAWDVRRRFAPGARLPWRLWADLTRGYAALLLARVPRPVPTRTVTVFVAASPAVPHRPSGPAPREARPERPERPERSDRPDRRDRKNRRARRDGPDRPARTDRTDRPDRTDHPSPQDHQGRRNGPGRDR